MLLKPVFLKTVTLLLVFVAFSQPAYAYLDPGTGSMIIQIVIGSFIAAAAAGRFYWSKIKEFFSKSKSKSDNVTD